MKFKRYKAVLIVALFLVAVLLVERERILQGIGDYLVISNPLHRADVIHVIAGPDNRTDHGIRLCKQGYAQKIFFTGGWCDDHRYFHGRHGRERAIMQGVPESAIAYDDSKVISTYEEGVRLREYAAANHWTLRSVIVVSDPHHMRRARTICRDVFGAATDIQMAPVPFDQALQKRRWFADPGSRAMVKDEYLKILYYYARYRFSFGPVRRWLESLDKN